MVLTIAILKESHTQESRVAAIPETVAKLVKLGLNVEIETEAGTRAYYLDSHYQEAGAKISKTRDSILKKADIILSIRPPSKTELSKMKKGAFLIGGLNPYGANMPPVDYAKASVNAFAMELMPRITRAQSMDILSSQSNLAGYKAVLDATQYFTRAMPSMMTAAGAIKPAKVFVMGAGVAGLQAIATARRLGAIVTATDVRPAVKEQVESLGAKFIAVENDEFKEAETAGGYAKEMSKDYQKQQAALVAEHIADQDIVITTALIPGRPAPRLIDAEMVKSMRPGSVIVDLAVENGGNVEGAKAGEAVTKDGVTIIGHTNVPGRLATDASALFARNLYNLLALIVDKESGKLAVDWSDDIIQGIALTRAGKVIHPNFQITKKAPTKKPAAKKATAKKPATKKKTTTTKSKAKSTAKKTTGTKG